MLEFTDEQFREVKEKGEAFYKSVDEVYCDCGEYPDGTTRALLVS